MLRTKTKFFICFFEANSEKMETNFLENFEFNQLNLNEKTRAKKGQPESKTQRTLPQANFLKQSRLLEKKSCFSKGKIAYSNSKVADSKGRATYNKSTYLISWFCVMLFRFCMLVVLDKINSFRRKVFFLIKQDGPPKQ